MEAGLPCGQRNGNVPLNKLKDRDPDIAACLLLLETLFFKVLQTLLSFIPKSHWSKKKTETPNEISQIRLGACRPSRALQCGITFTFPVPEGTLFSPYILLEKTTTVQQIQQWQFTLFRRECVSDRQPPPGLHVHVFPMFPRLRL